MNRDQFKRLPCFSLKTASFHLFFPPLYGVVWSIHLALSQKSLSASSSLFQSLSHLCLSPSSLLQLNPDRSSAQITAHSLNHFLPLSHAHLCLSPLSPSQLTLCLVAVTVVWYFISSNLLFLC